jgi:hypothetical protein
VIAGGADISFYVGDRKEGTAGHGHGALADMLHALRGAYMKGHVRATREPRINLGRGRPLWQRIAAKIISTV